MQKVLFLETGIYKISNFIHLVITHQVCFIREGAGKDTLILLSVFLLSLFAVIKVFYSSYLNVLFKSVYNHSVAHELFLESASIPLRIKLTVLSLSILSIASFVGAFYAFNHQIDVSPAYLIDILKISFVISVWLIVRTTVLKFLGYLSTSENLIDEYNQTFLNTIRIVALPYVALSIVILFGHEILKSASIYLGLTMAIGIFLHTWYKGMIITQKNYIAISYKLLFLVSFELIPIALFLSTIFRFI